MGQGPKEALTEAKSGTPVAAKNFSSKKKEAKASGTDKASASKGSMTVALSLPHVTDTGDGYENSYRDHAADYSAARRKGIPVEQYEGSAHDRIADKAGAKSMRDTPPQADNTSNYRPGVSAFSNTPKASHGFGHPASAKQGHLRNSGNSGAHRVGKRK